MSKSIKALMKKLKVDVKIDPNMEDYSNDPYFLEKAELAQKFLEKHGVPKFETKITKKERKFRSKA